MGVFLLVFGGVVASFDIALCTLLSLYLHKDYSNTEDNFEPDCLQGHIEILFFIALLLLLTVLTALLFILTPKNAKLMMFIPYLTVFLLKLVLTIACAIALFYPKEEEVPDYLIMQYLIPGPKMRATDQSRVLRLPEVKIL